MGILDFIVTTLHVLNQIAEPVLTILAIVLGKRYMISANTQDAVNKARQLAIMAEDLVRLILDRTSEHPAHLKLEETKVDGKNPASFLSEKAKVSLDAAERALVAAKSRLAEKV